MALLTLRKAGDALDKSGVELGCAKNYSALRYLYINRDSKNCGHVFRKPAGRVLVDMDALHRFLQTPA